MTYGLGGGAGGREGWHACQYNQAPPRARQGVVRGGGAQNGRGKRRGSEVIVAVGCKCGSHECTTFCILSANFFRFPVKTTQPGKDCLHPN